MEGSSSSLQCGRQRRQLLWQLPVIVGAICRRQQQLMAGGVRTQGLLQAYVSAAYVALGPTQCCFEAVLRAHCMHDTPAQTYMLMSVCLGPLYRPAWAGMGAAGVVMTQMACRLSLCHGRPAVRLHLTPPRCVYWSRGRVVGLWLQVHVEEGWGDSM